MPDEQIVSLALAGVSVLIGLAGLFVQLRRKAADEQAPRPRFTKPIQPPHATVKQERASAQQRAFERITNTPTQADFIAQRSFYELMSGQGFTAIDTAFRGLPHRQQ